MLLLSLLVLTFSTLLGIRPENSLGSQKALTSLGQLCPLTGKDPRNSPNVFRNWRPNPESISNLSPRSPREATSGTQFSTPRPVLLPKASSHHLPALLETLKGSPLPPESPQPGTQGPLLGVISPWHEPAPK